ncbi:hypothetical protein PIB30_014261 [Stylosanthes scabra]|uniref:Uncharacterized protein n=1 Tax=Stylosanthes scabra TaxID=79078 RepID=A0ABU6Y3J6_9FABA|nr:hypothetical protein [Stylosanthes scabra]
MSPPQSNGNGKSTPLSKSLFLEPGGKRSKFQQAVQANVLSRIIFSEHFVDCPFEHADFSKGWSSRTIDVVDNVKSFSTSNDNSAIWVLSWLHVTPRASTTQLKSEPVELKVFTIPIHEEKN